MYRIDFSDCPDILELGLMAAANPDFIEKAVAALIGGDEEMKPGEGGSFATLKDGSPFEAVQHHRRGSR